MSLRARIFIIISVTVLVILAISLVLLLRSRKMATTPASQNSSGGATLPESSGGGNSSLPTVPSVTTPIPNTPRPITTNPVEVEQAGVANLAKVFVERFNSYSTDSNWQNVREIESLVTQTLWKRLSSRIGSSQTGNFVGVTTNVLTSVISNWQDTKAAVAVQVVKTTDTNGTQTREHQNGTINLVKIGKNWLVDSFVWAK